MTSGRAPKQRFGAHMSIAGGLHNAFDEAVAADSDCLQIFVKNQRQWTAKPLEDAAIAAYRAAEARTGIGPVVAHATYLINLGSPDAALRNKSILALVDELNRCEALGVSGLVLHPGAHMGEGEAAGIARIAAALDEAHRATAGFKTRVLLETTAGQGSTLGHQPAQLGKILAGTAEAERVGICIDTCHVFAAGYDIRTDDGYDRLMTELESACGLARVACLHVNDSKGDLGSHVDRHDHIGDGKIGRAGFERILNDPRLAAVPRILETPKEDDSGAETMDRVNLSRLRELIRR